ncbi:winged helix-turn-helix domain-containing protein, partial [Clavibacter nebraskensis]
MVDTVSPALARRVALGAQGLGRPHADAAGTRRLAAEIRRLGLLQI